ncbi:hypothetical protein HN51_038343 [Arachis hypogaea]
MKIQMNFTEVSTLTPFGIMVDLSSAFFMLKEKVLAYSEKKWEAMPAKFSDLNAIFQKYLKSQRVTWGIRIAISFSIVIYCLTPSDSCVLVYNKIKLIGLYGLMAKAIIDSNNSIILQTMHTATLVCGYPYGKNLLSTFIQIKYPS